MHLRVELGIGKLSEMLGEEKRGLFNRLEKSTESSNTPLVASRPEVGNYL